MTLPHHPHDSFFKELFSRPEAAEDFVRHYLPPEWWLYWNRGR
jgi:hypothetical protein